MAQSAASTSGNGQPTASGSFSETPLRRSLRRANRKEENLSLKVLSDICRYSSPSHSRNQKGGAGTEGKEPVIPIPRLPESEIDDHSAVSRKAPPSVHLYPRTSKSADSKNNMSEEATSVDDLRYGDESFEVREEFLIPMIPDVDTRVNQHKKRVTQYKKPSGKHSGGVSRTTRKRQSVPAAPKKINSTCTGEHGVVDAETAKARKPRSQRTYRRRNPLSDRELAVYNRGSYRYPAFTCQTAVPVDGPQDEPTGELVAAPSSDTDVGMVKVGAFVSLFIFNIANKIRVWFAETVQTYIYVVHAALQATHSFSRIHPSLTKSDVFLLFE